MDNTIYGGYIRTYGDNHKIISVGADLGKSKNYSIPKLFLKDNEIYMSNIGSSLGYFKVEEGVVGDYLQDSNEKVFHSDSPEVIKEVLELLHDGNFTTILPQELVDKLIQVK